MQEKHPLFGMTVYCVNTPQILFWFKSCFGLHNYQLKLETRKLPPTAQYFSDSTSSLFGSIAAEVSDVHTCISSLSPSPLEVTNFLLMEHVKYRLVQDTQCCYHKQQTNQKMTAAMITDNAYPISNKHPGCPEGH